MDERQRTQLSKFLSLVLRHRPATIGIELDAAGWVDVDFLLERCRANDKVLSSDDLAEVVATNPKKRFEFNEDRSRLRASQGHSVPVELGYQPAQPPEFLFHGMVAEHLVRIRQEGLRRMSRHHVHLSPDLVTAAIVGARHGEATILRVHAQSMVKDGHVFFRSTNGVWLTDEVPASHIESMDDAE